MRVTSEDHTAITLLIGCFIWFDILACASTGSKPFFDLDHVFLLESSRFHLEELMGCQNWVMVLIFQISELGHWKKDLERTHKLSIAELAKRGAQIEARLQERLVENISQDTIQNCPVSGITLHLSQASSVAITKIFALSALTYLHVTVSGANPELPEVVDSVSRTIAEFRILNDPRLLRYLVWPFCITGCLATEEQQYFFRTLISPVKLSKRTVGTCMEAFKLMEECWKRRKTGLGNCDWMCVMHSMNQLILLG
jgi:hypothetical protein